MNKPSLLNVIGSGILLSVIASLTFYFAFIFTTFSLAWLFTITTVAVLYLTYLNHIKRGTPGSVLCLTGVLILFSIWCVLSLSIGLYALFCALIIWVAKSNTFKYGIASRIYDFMMTGLSLVAAYAVFIRTGSVAMTIWSFFLCQVIALFVQSQFIQTLFNQDAPSRTCFAKQAQRTHKVNEQFERAYQSAESAIRDMS